MKDKIARTLIYLLLGLLACHIKMLGCYPFVAVIFGACYLNEENRRLCVPFSYLWMVLFLPIAALFRYGVTFLVWMVVLAIFWHMHILVRRMGQTSLLGMILAPVLVLMVRNLWQAGMFHATVRDLTLAARDMAALLHREVVEHEAARKAKAAASAEPSLPPSEGEGP